MPASSEALRALSQLQELLFERTGSASFLALPPLSLVSSMDDLPDTRQFADVGTSVRSTHEGPDTGGHIEAAREAAQLFYVPDSDRLLRHLWEDLRSRVSVGTSLPVVPRPAFYLGSAEGDLLDDMSGLIPRAGNICNYTIHVLDVTTAHSSRWWEDIRWESVYEREIGHRALQ